MKIKITVKNATSEWSEEYDRAGIGDNGNILQAQDWAYQLIETFNETLRPFEKRRELIGVEIIGKSAPAHDWIKRTNGMSVEFRGALVDLFECRKCGITGKRFRLGDAVKRDSKYKAQRFANCIAEK